MPLFNTGLGAHGAALLLSGRHRLHFIGIGGIQMSALAELAMARGFRVTGSDTAEGEQVIRLRRMGIPVTRGHDTALLADCDAVIYSLAVSEQDPEYLTAVALGLPVLSRADLLAFLTSPYPCRIAVAGSHGKSSVTAMLAHILTRAGRSPTVLCGAALDSNHSALQKGEGEICVMEACEYRDSFLALSPTLALLLSFDLDHTDYFPDETALSRSFSRFAARAARLVCNGEDERLAALAAAHPNAICFGVSRGDVFAASPRFVEGCAHFTLMLCQKEAGEVTLRVPGRHNLQNALAAATAAHLCGVADEVIAAALSDFTGLSRRMEYKGLYRGARVIDDYAHHPREIAAVLSAVRNTGKTGRLFAVFQPHTYTRTKAFFSAICDALRGADRVLLTSIYAARETDTLGLDERLLAQEIGTHATYVPDFTSVALTLSREVAPGDTVLVMGAGDTRRLFALLGL